jgi:acyl-CoA thioester hydrolase
MADPGQPFSAYAAMVRPEWLDYNGHMHDASYATVLSDANEEFFDWLGLSEDYRVTTGAAFYTVETHIRFLAECSAGQRLTAATLLVAADTKRIRLYTELFADDGASAAVAHEDRSVGSTLVATGESLYVHVDGAAGRVTPMPDDRQARVDDVLRAHALLPRPAHLGRGIHIQPR